MTYAELDQLEHSCLPTLGACPGQFTANTMAMVSETLGLALPGSATMPAPAAERLGQAREAGRMVMDVLRNGGPLALMRNGDRIKIDAHQTTLSLCVPAAELARRRRAWKLPSRAPLNGVLEKYASEVGSAFRGAVTHSGGIRQRRRKMRC